MNIADRLKDGESISSSGYCGTCKRETEALWERFGDRLSVSCAECGTIYINEHI